MSNVETLLERNRAFARDYTNADLPPLPTLRTVVVACGDARSDPAHVLGLQPGEAIVIRNNGGRVTPAVIEEVAALAFLAAKMEGGGRPFDVVVMHHTQCGAERFADLGLQRALRAQTGVDVAPVAIADHDESLRDDVGRLRRASAVPDYVSVFGWLYDVQTGWVREVVAPVELAA